MGLCTLGEKEANTSQAGRSACAKTSEAWKGTHVPEMLDIWGDRSPVWGIKRRIRWEKSLES